MDTLTIAQVEALFEEQQGWCVSVYMPTHRAGSDVREDPIRLKNRLKEAEEQLEKRGVAGGDIRRLCQRARDLCDRDLPEVREFWQHQADGLALFLSQSEMRPFRLPRAFEELTVVAHRFHVKPLIKTLQRDEQYCVLAVSQNQVRFLEGSRSGLSARPVEDLPENLREVVGGGEQKGFGLHSFRVRANAPDSAVPHGHVESHEEHDRTRYFQVIDEALAEVLKQDQRPLIFAGVEELFPYFRRTSSYDHVVDSCVAGNPDELNDDELHERAWPVVEPIFSQRQSEAVQRWNAARHTNLGGDSLEDIVVATHDGRVETLLLQDRLHRWGTYDARSRRVQRDEVPTAENYDLTDLAAVKALQSDARVVIVDAEREGHAQQLGDDGMAAIYRFAAGR